MRATFLLSSALALTFCFSPLANSQISDPVVSATAPVPGSGRAYTGLQFYKSIEGTGLETAPKIDSRSK
jgi:hypothetical protein